MRAADDEEIPDLDILLLLQPSTILHGGKDYGKGAAAGEAEGGGGSSGFELRLGASKLQIAVRAAPEWRSQLSASGLLGKSDAHVGTSMLWDAEGVSAVLGADGAAVTRAEALAAYEAARGPNGLSAEGVNAELATLGAMLREQATPPRVKRDAEVVWLPDTALHATIELREDGPQPMVALLAFGSEALRLNISPQKLEALSFFGSRLHSLQPPEGGDPPTNVALVLPAVDIELDAGTQLKTDRPAPLTAQVGGLSPSTQHAHVPLRSSIPARLRGLSPANHAHAHALRTNAHGHLL